EHHRVLAPLAHHAVALPARIPLQSARGQPEGPLATLRESLDHHAAGGLVAWRGLDVRRLGRAARLLPGGQPPLACAPPALRRRPRDLNGTRRRMGQLITFVAVVVAWVVFRSE